MEIEQAIHYILDGDAVLFTGAGFSWGASNRLDRPIPSGAKLAELLLAQIGYAGKTTSLDKASTAFLRRKSDTDLVNYLVDQFTPTAVTSGHETIAALPWRRVYTTNYDTVYELGRKRAGGKVTSLDAVDEPMDHLHKGNVIVHINGSVDRVSTSRLNNSFKLTTTSYATDAFMSSPWAFHFRADLRAAKAIIFIGYSMYDLDIRRIIYEEDMSDRCLFVTAPLTDDNALEAEDLSDLGHLAPIGVDAFAEQAKLYSITHTQRDEELLLNVWTELSGLSVPTTPPTDQQVQDFLIFGRANTPLLSEATGPSSGLYCLPRGQIEQICTVLRASPSTVVLHGGLGSGKSFIASVAGQLLVRAGLRVFHIDAPAKDATAEAEKILNVTGDKVFIVDGYRRHLDLLKRISELTGSDCRLLLLERSSSHELVAEDLEKISKTSPQEFDIDALTNTELQGATQLLDRHGLWGERQAWNNSQKLNYLRNDCEAKLSHLLVSVLNAAHITERYRDILATAPNERELRTILVAVSALTVLEHMPRVPLLQELLGSNVILNKYKRYSELQDIIDISSREIRIKSSVLAQHLLQKVFAAGHVVEALILLVRRASELRHDGPEFRHIHSDLMRYSSIAQMLPEKDRLNAIIKYYENLKDLPSTKENPQFWLQYAIGCLTHRNLRRAEIYFATAYSFARKYDNYDTFQIDNHYARFLLQKALTEPSLLDAMEQVYDARDIILRQVKSEVRNYPFRVARGLFDAYDTLLPRMSDNMKKQLLASLAEIFRRASGINGKLRNDRYVQECIQRGAALGLA